MNRIARSIMFMLATTTCVFASGCTNVLSPDPATIEYDGAVFNTTDENRRVYIADPDPEYGPGTEHDYTKPRRIDALIGVQSYWLRERYYTFVILHAVTGEEIARVKRRPNGVHNDAAYGRTYPGLDWRLVNTQWTE